jgi:phage terminase large subunit-like protein
MLLSGLHGHQAQTWCIDTHVDKTRVTKNFKNNNIFKWKAHAKAETTYRLYEDYLYVIEDIVEMRAELGVIVI